MCKSIPLTENPRHLKYIELLREQGKKSKMYHRHGACLVYRNKVISVGYNSMSHLNGYTTRADNLYSVHAEVSAIREFLRLAPRMGLKKNILKDCTLYVVRIGKESMDYPLKLSKPCKNCMNFIKKYNIKILSDGVLVIVLIVFFSFLMTCMK